MTNELRLRPSDAERWMNCPGSLKYQKQLGIEQSTSEYATEGVEAHRVAESILNNNPIPCTEEMGFYVQEYVDYVKSLGGKQLYEQQVILNDFIPNGKGTCDTIVIKDDHLIIVDLKYGAGVRVDAYKNPQLLLYALGAYSNYGMIYDVKKVTVVVHQPRLDHVSEYELSVSELLEFGNEIVRKVVLVNSDNPVLTVGESQCRFCACKPVCKAIYEKTKSTVSFSSHETGLSDEELCGVIADKKLIVNWLESVEEHVKNRLLAGSEFEGYKLVEGRGSRGWSNELDAETVLKSELGDSAYIKKLLSVAQAEKKLGKARKELIEPLVVKSAGKPKLVTSNSSGDRVNVVPTDFKMYSN